MSVWKMIVVAGGSALVLAACGTGPPTSSASVSSCSVSSASATAAAQTVKLVADPNTIGAYDPKTVSVKVGQAVEWDWQDAASQHSVTANDASFDSGVCSQGTKFTFTFSKAGTFAYTCSIHSAMQGTVTVS